MPPQRCGERRNGPKTVPLQHDRMHHRSDEAQNPQIEVFFEVPLGVLLGICFSPARSNLDESGNPSLAFSPCVSERGYPILIRNIRISTGGENQFGNFHMSRSTISGNDDLEETGPAEVVDMIHIYICRQK